MLVEGKPTIEINGVKLEIDLRHTRRDEELRVGSKVRVMTKNHSGHEVHAGILHGDCQNHKLLPRNSL